MNLESRIARKDLRWGNPLLRISDRLICHDDLDYGDDSDDEGSSDIVSSLFSSAVSIGANAANLAVNNALQTNTPQAVLVQPAPMSSSSGWIIGGLIVIGLLVVFAETR